MPNGAQALMKTLVDAGEREEGEGFHGGLAAAQVRPLLHERADAGADGRGPGGEPAEGEQQGGEHVDGEVAGVEAGMVM